MGLGVSKPLCLYLNKELRKVQAKGFTENCVNEQSCLEIEFPTYRIRF